MTTETNPTDGRNQPDLYIHVKRYDQKGNSKIGSRIGVGFFHGDQTGVNIMLDAQPIAHNGSIELIGLPPKDRS